MNKRREQGKKRINARSITEIALFVAMITVSAWITVPFPIPFTMQLCAVMLCAACIGPVRSLVAIVAYIILGVIGVPVFSGFNGGIGHLFGMTGGYILGFIPATVITGYLVLKFGKKGNVPVFLSMLAGNIICYICGVLYYALVHVSASFWQGVWTGVGALVLPFIISDIAKLFLALVLWSKLKKLSFGG